MYCCRNCGGMLELSLRLEGHESKLWRYYTSEVLYPLRFAEKHADVAKYRPPTDLVREQGGAIRSKKCHKI